jgi:drug/metabolite transporter (DMT)-like permease
MNPSTLGLIIVSVTLSALAQISFKTGVSAPRVRDAMASGDMLGTLLSFATSPAILGGLALYGIGTLMWFGVLAKIDVSQAYPFVGLSFILVAVLGYLLFNETLNVTRLSGTALIIAGVALVARS